MIVLRAISARSAEALLAGRPPDDVVVAPDHPTEFSAVGEIDDEHDGATLRVREWELVL